MAPPGYPYEIDTQLAARGKPLYERYCASCHGQDGRDFSGESVGKVVPIDEIGTDRHRLDSYTLVLAANQNTLYAGYPWRFSRFKKTNGYANLPLDGIWLRGPYLHNGSVPTLRDLLEAPGHRPEVFFRGYDVIDRRKVGFGKSASSRTLRKKETDTTSNTIRGCPETGTRDTFTVCSSPLPRRKRWLST